MSYFKTSSFTVKNEAGSETLKVKININSQGEFYCSLPEYLAIAAKGVFGFVNLPEDEFTVKVSTLKILHENIYKTLRVFAKPVITEEPIIRYNIESHVSFAEDKQGNVYPNAGFKNAEWKDNNKYGNHNATKPSYGGYSLVIGAEALIKTVYKYGDSEKVEYAAYYKEEGKHLGSDNPAELLNSWCSMNLNDGCETKEIPYTDEAALFFHNLLFAMAQLSKRIQESTFEQKSLLKLILNGQKLLP